MQQGFRDAGMPQDLVPEMAGHPFRSAAPDDDSFLQVHHAQGDRHILEHVTADFSVLKCSHLPGRESNAPVTFIGSHKERLNPQRRGVGRAHHRKGCMFLQIQAATLVQVMAGLGYSQKFASVLFSLLTVLGGGLPGRPGFSKIQGARHCDKILLWLRARGVNPRKRGLLLRIQFVEIVKLTVIFACVSTGSAPM